MASAISTKLLECNFCKGVFSIQKENFPEDLYDLMKKYSKDQLIWLCRNCKEKSYPAFQFFAFAEKQSVLEQQVMQLKARVDELSNSLLQVKEAVFIKPLNNMQNNGSMNSNSIEELDSSMNSASVSYQSISERSLKDNCSMSLQSSSSEAITFNSSSIHKEVKTKIKSIIKDRIKINDSELTRNKSIITSFFDKIIDCLKENEVFRCLYEKPYQTGSSYENLRISNATEYDINIVLKLPCKKFECTVEFFPYTKVFAKCKWSTILNSNVQQNLNDTVWNFLVSNSFKSEDGNHYLLPSKIQAWMQSIIVKALNDKPQFSDEIQDVSNHKSGPAQTITIKTQNDSICLDLVPVFQFGYPNQDEIAAERELFDQYPIKDAYKFWFLVPKQCEGLENMTESDCEISWRMHFPELEKHILFDMACVKPIIKLLKLLRDKEKWSLIASYYLKTVLLWEVKNKQNAADWGEDSIFVNLLQVLQQLSNYLKEGKLPYFFDSSYNLIHKLNKSFCNGVSCRLQKICSHLEKDPLYLDKYF